jgi:hypothetical protein
MAVFKKFAFSAAWSLAFYFVSLMIGNLALGAWAGYQFAKGLKPLAIAPLVNSVATQITSVSIGIGLIALALALTGRLPGTRNNRSAQ